jgi:Ca2+-binding EF-hand superfamily protein
MKPKLLLGVIAGLFTTGAVLAQSAPAPSSDRAAKMQEHFSKLDKNGDGAISRDEAAGNKRLAKEFDEIDANKDGKLTQEEMQAHRAAMRTRQTARFEERFKAADKNGDGAISKDEAVNMPGLAKHFDQLDVNHDGKLTREELQAARGKMHGRHGEHMARFEQRFKAADKDGDGALTKAEAEAGKMERLVKNFDQLDTNKDGKVTRAELQAAMGKHKQ